MCWKKVNLFLLFPFYKFPGNATLQHRIIKEEEFIAKYKPKFIKQFLTQIIYLRHKCCYNKYENCIKNIASHCLRTKVISAQVRILALELTEKIFSLNSCNVTLESPKAEGHI